MFNHVFPPLTLLAGPAGVHAQYGWYMYGGPGTMMGFGWGAWGIFHAIFWAILVAVAVACIVMIRRPDADRNGTGNAIKPSAPDQLDDRYPRGESDREETPPTKPQILDRNTGSTHIVIP